MLWLAILSLMLIISSGLAMRMSKSSPINVTEFEDHPGIYFENLGRAGVITSDWHIYLSIDLTRYYNELKLLRDSVNNLQQLCQYRSHCSEITNNLMEKIEEIRRSNKMIQTNGEARSKRSAPLGIVGWMQHEIFGVMDQESADHIELQFDTVRSNENHLLELMKNQTSVSEITLGLMKTTQEEMNENFERIGQMVDRLQNITNQGEEALSMALYLSLMVHSLENFQNNLVEMITDVHQGHINNHLFTPEIFLQQLEKINNNLPTGTKIPDTPKDDLKSLYKLLKGKARVTRKRVVFDLVLPLISTSEYELFKLIPVPTKHGNQRVAIIPESSYLLITLERDKFYQLDQIEYNACLKTTTLKKICKLQHPIYTTQSNRSLCERELLRQNTDINEFCRLKITADEDFWIRLEGNKWIYGVQKERTLNVVCNKKAIPIKIQGSGTMQIRPGCSIIQPDMKITAEIYKSSDGLFDFNPKLNLSKTMVTKQLRVANFTIDHSLQLHNLNNNLMEIDRQTKLERIQHYTHYGSHTLIWLIIAFTVIIIWKNKDALKKLFVFLTSYMVTSTGHLMETSWQQWRSRLPHGQHRRPNQNAIELVGTNAERGEDVRTGHSQTI